VVAFLFGSIKPRWLSLSFPSTLYLCSILDLLLAEIPEEFYAELRLGLQEALVNAAKHGNQLDPSKFVSVRYRYLNNRCEWIIADQGLGFVPPQLCHSIASDDRLPEDGCDCGRGLYILYQIFDQVCWNGSGTELSLVKSFNTSPLISEKGLFLKRLPRSLKQISIL
jgi:serine/threonine-protein kinase RsbW